jgi:ubiquinone biosynthesis monooxygenase Coq7
MSDETASEETAPARRAPVHPGEHGLTRRREEMIRVDHAGEFGAVQIYRGQRAVFDRLPAKAHASALLREMEEGEKVHLETFDRIVRERGVRPTAMAPVWRLAGFTLGAATALLGEEAAHACTAAVEEVIEQHYAAQAVELADDDPDLKATILKFREDEIGHKTTALNEGAEQAPLYPLLSAAIKLGCRVAIKVSEKI